AREHANVIVGVARVIEIDRILIRPTVYAQQGIDLVEHAAYQRAGMVDGAVEVAGVEGGPDIDGIVASLAVDRRRATQRLHVDLVVPRASVDGGHTAVGAVHDQAVTARPEVRPYHLNIDVGDPGRPHTQAQEPGIRELSECAIRVTAVVDIE